MPSSREASFRQTRDGRHSRDTSAPPHAASASSGVPRDPRDPREPAELTKLTRLTKLPQGAEAIRRTHAKFDRNRSGTLSVNELKTALKELGLDVDNHESARRIAR